MAETPQAIPVPIEGRERHQSGSLQHSYFPPEVSVTPILGASEEGGRTDCILRHM